QSRKTTRPPGGGCLSSRSFSPGWPGSWTARSRLWRRSSRPHSRLTKVGRRFWSASPPQSGAGISMGFAEALSDDGSLTGRGRPTTRGLVCGVMTAAGGLGHTLPYLIPDIRVATWIAVAVVLVELVLIAWIRHRYMDTPWGRSLVQVVVGGALVFLA